MKKIILTAAAASLLLTGCGKKDDDFVSFVAYVTPAVSEAPTAKPVPAEKHDISEYGCYVSLAYQDYLDYAFCGDYDMERVSQDFITEEGKAPRGSTTWKLTYTDGGGNKRTKEYVSYQFTDDDKEHYCDEQSMNDNKLALLMSELISDKVEGEFCEELLSKYFSGNFNYETNRFESDEIGTTVLAYTVLADRDKDNKVVHQLVSPESGYSYADMGLKEYAQSPDFIFTFYLQLPEGADLDDYTEKFMALKQDFLDYTGTPMNYVFGIRNSDYEELYLEEYVMGKEYTESPDNKLAWEIWREYENIYGIKISY